MGVWASIYTVFHKKTNPFDFLLYLCQIVDSFYKNDPVCTLKYVLSSTTKNLHLQNVSHQLQFKLTVSCTNP